MRQRNHCGGLSHCKTNLLCRLHALEWDEIQKPTWVRQAWHGMICRPFRDFGMIIGESVCPPLARWLIICGPDGLWLLPRSRARKGAEGGIPAEKPCLHDPQRRVPHMRDAAYRLSALPL